MNSLSQNDQVQVRDPTNRLDWRRALVLRHATRAKDSTVAVVFRGSTVHHQIPWANIKPLVPLASTLSPITPRLVDSVVVDDDDDDDDDDDFLDDNDNDDVDERLDDVQDQPDVRVENQPLNDTPFPGISPGPPIESTAMHSRARRRRHGLDEHPMHANDHESSSSLPPIDDAPMPLQRSNDTVVYGNTNSQLYNRPKWKQEDKYPTSHNASHVGKTENQYDSMDYENLHNQRHFSPAPDRHQIHNRSRYFRHQQQHRYQQPQQNDFPTRSTYTRTPPLRSFTHRPFHNPASKAFADISSAWPGNDGPPPSSASLDRFDFKPHSDSIGPASIPAGTLTPLYAQPPLGHSRHPNVWQGPAPRILRKPEPRPFRNRRTASLDLSKLHDDARGPEFDEQSDDVSPPPHARHYLSHAARRRWKRQRLSAGDIFVEINSDGFGITTHSSVNGDGSKTHSDDTPQHRNIEAPQFSQLPDIVPMFDAINPLQTESSMGEASENIIPESDIQDLIDLDKLSLKSKVVKFVPFPVRHESRRNPVSRNRHAKRTASSRKLQKKISQEWNASSSTLPTHTSGVAYGQFASPTWIAAKSKLNSKKQRDPCRKDKATYIRDIECSDAIGHVNPSTTGLLVHECLCGKIEEPDVLELSGLCGSIQCGQCGLWSHLRCLQMSKQEVEDFCAQKRRFFCWNCVSVYPTCDFSIDVDNPDDIIEDFEGAIQMKPVLPFQKSSLAEYDIGVGVKPKKWNWIRKPLEEDDCRARAKNVEALREGLSPPLVSKKEQTLIDTLLTYKILGSNT